MLLPKQEWRDIEGYEGLYQVNQIGQVRSLNYRMTGKTKRLKLGTDKGGYKVVRLCKNGKYKTFTVHRLVAQAFIPNPNNLPFINHMNEIKSDNRVENLEWCDITYNNNYGTRNERIANAMIGKNKGNDNGRSRKIRCIELNKPFPSIADANVYFGKDRRNANIYRCLMGRQQTAWGYHWEYVEE